MPTTNPLSLIQIAVDVCRHHSCNAVMVAGWSELTSSQECLDLLEQHKTTIFITQSCPHDWLFSKCDVIIHHGGVGTSAAALRAGKPQIICPFMLDQPHNAALLKSLGVAPDTVPYSDKFSSKMLIAGVGKVIGDEEVYRRYVAAAEDAAEVVRKECETALSTYCDLVERAPRQ